MESDLQEMESKSGKPYNCSSLLPGETFQLHMQGGGTQPEGSWEKQAWDEEMVLKCGETQVMDITGHMLERVELQRKKTWKSAEFPSSFQLSTAQFYLSSGRKLVWEYILL